MDERLEHFRACIARLDLAANPRRAIKEGWYVDPPERPLARELAADMQLAPASSHIVVGCVGSGKSTELIQASAALAEADDTLTMYLDVSRFHDLSQDLRGVLVILTGLDIGKRLTNADSNEITAAKKKFNNWAHGYNVWIPYEPEPWDDEPQDDDYGEPGEIIRHPGILKPPLESAGFLQKDRVAALKDLRRALPEPIRHVIMLFDSLDRLPDIEGFKSIVSEDLKELHLAGIGAVVVGPRRLTYGPNRAIVDLFDKLHVQPAWDVQHSPEARDFLAGVLSRRADESMLSPPIRNALVRLSGGIMRDMIGLARGAIEEAFLGGAEQVEESHLNRAADRFGRSMMIGLRVTELNVLKRLMKHGQFVPVTDDDLALLESRRVIEYSAPATRYDVHPTIGPLLATME